MFQPNHYMDWIGCSFSFNFFFCRPRYDHSSLSYQPLNENASFSLLSAISQEPMVAQKMEGGFRKLGSILYNVLACFFRKNFFSILNMTEKFRKTGLFEVFQKITCHIENIGNMTNVKCASYRPLYPQKPYKVST